MLKETLYTGDQEQNDPLSKAHYAYVPPVPMGSLIQQLIIRNLDGFLIVGCDIRVYRRQLPLWCNMPPMEAFKYFRMNASYSGALGIAHDATRVRQPRARAVDEPPSKGLCV